MNPAKLVRDSILRDGESLTLSELCEALADSSATPACFVPDPPAVWRLCLNTPGIGTDTGRGTVWNVKARELRDSEPGAPGNDDDRYHEPDEPYPGAWA